MVDFLIVGAGLFGAICARELKDSGKSVLVIEKRNHIAGNAFTERIEGIDIHKYGAHIFHTNEKRVWEYVNRFAEFNRFTNSPKASYQGKLYSLPFNMNTFYEIWGVKKPEEAAAIIKKQRKEISGEPRNLEEQAISLVGRDIYERLIKGYTEKQWGRSCTDLPASIIKRLPVRLIFDSNYFNAEYQGIPKDGYTGMVENMLDGIDVELETPYQGQKASRVIYTGTIDEYFGYRFGRLQYRTARFETEVLNEPNYQGNAVINYTDKDVPWTRIIEHKHFNFGNQPKTIISREYPEEWIPGKDQCYPIADEKNLKLYEKYANLARYEKGVFFGGRLGLYKYLDMDQTISKALDLVAFLR